MLQLFTIAVLLFFSNSLLARYAPTHFDIEVAKKRCSAHYSQTPELYFNEFSWGYTLLEMENKFNEVYESGLRIGHHANFDSDQNRFLVYLDGSQGARVIPITPLFIKSVTRQIELAHQEGFSDFAFFPDMGHSHLYFDQDHWNESYGKMDKTYDGQQQLYTKMLSDPKMKALYHLTEQLQMQDENKELLPDEILQFKFWNRNFLGHNDGSDSFQTPIAPKDENRVYSNTVSSLENHGKWSSGFAVSASKDGCFPYRDKNGVTRYFDISLHDPAPDPDKLKSDPEFF